MILGLSLIKFTHVLEDCASVEKIKIRSCVFKVCVCFRCEEERDREREREREREGKETRERER